MLTCPDMALALNMPVVAFRRGCGWTCGSGIGSVACSSPREEEEAESRPGEPFYFDPTSGACVDPAAV